jgi:hypothetical protein
MEYSLMANVFKNPVILDTFTSDIDVGVSMYGFSEVPFHIDYIEWQTPANIGDHAVVTNESGIPIFDEYPSVAKQSVFKPFGGKIYTGLKVASGGVGSGKIVIQLR